MAQLARLAEWYMAVLPEALTYVSPVLPEPKFPELPQLPCLHRGPSTSRKRPSSRSQRSTPGAHREGPSAGPSSLAAPADQSRPSSQRWQRRSARGRSRHALAGPRFFLIQRHLLAMQERRERLKQCALSKQQQPRRAVSALPILDAWPLDLEVEQSELEVAVEELRLAANCERGLCLALDAPCPPDALQSEDDAGQAAESLRRSSSCAAISPPALLSSSTFSPFPSPSASRHSPSLSRVKLRRQKVAKSPSNAGLDATDSYQPGRSAIEDGHAEASVPLTRLQLRRGKRGSKNEEVCELLAAVCNHSENTDLAVIQRNNAVETALKFLGAVLVLSPATSGSENATDATGAAAHLLIDSSHRSKILSGMKMKQRGKDSFSQNNNNATADEISVKFVSTTIESSVTVSSENTESNSTDIPVVAVRRNSLNVHSFNKPTVAVGQDQPDTSGFAVSSNKLHSVIYCNRRATDKSNFHPENSIKDNAGYPTAKYSFSQEPCGAYYTDRHIRKLDQKISKEVALIYASMRKSCTPKMSESNMQHRFDQLASSSLSKMNQKNNKTCSLRHTHAQAQFLPVDEKPAASTSERNDEVLYLSALGNKPSNHTLSNTAASQFLEPCQISAEDASRLCACMGFNYPLPSNSRVCAVDCNIPSSSQMLSRLASNESSVTAVGSQPVGTPHALASPHKSSVDHSTPVTSDTSCRIRSQKLGDRSDRRQRLSFDIPEIPPYRGPTRSKNVKRSTGDEKRAKRRRSLREISLSRENDKPDATRSSPSAMVLTTSTTTRELENLRPVSSSLVISPPTGFASPATGHSRPSTPLRSVHRLGLEGEISVHPSSCNVESYCVASTEGHEQLANVSSPSLQRFRERYGTGSRTIDFFPSSLPSPESSLPSSHSSPYVSASQTPEQTPPPSCPSSALKKLKGLSSPICSSLPAPLCQSSQQSDNDHSSKSNETLYPILNQAPIHSSENPLCGMTVLVSGSQMAEPAVKIINSPSHVGTNGCFLSSDNIQSELPETSHCSFSEIGPQINPEYSVSKTIFPSELELKFSQSVCSPAQEIQNVLDNSVKEKTYINETGNNIQMNRHVNQIISNETVPDPTETPESEIQAHDTANIPMSRSTTSELTVVPQSGFDTSYSTTILAPNSELPNITVVPGIKAQKNARSQERISNTSRMRRPTPIALKPLISGRGKTGKCDVSRSHANVSDAPVSALNTGKFASILTRAKSTSSSLVSKLVDRKGMCTLKLKPPSVTVRNSRSTVSGMLHVPASVSERSIRTTTPLRTSNELSGSKISEELAEPASNSKISTQGSLTNSNSKVFGKVLPTLMAHGKQIASAMLPEVSNQMHTISSDIKLSCQTDPLQSTPNGSNTVTSVTDHKNAEVKTTCASEFEVRKVKTELETTAIDTQFDLKVVENTESSTTDVETSSPKIPATPEWPTPSPTENFEKCGKYAALMACLSRHGELLRSAAARRGLSSTLPSSHQNEGPMTYMKYLRSLKQHLQLVRLVCPADPEESVASVAGDGLSNSISKLRLVPTAI